MRMLFHPLGCLTNATNKQKSPGNSELETNARKVAMMASLWPNGGRQPTFVRSNVSPRHFYGLKAAFFFCRTIFRVDQLDHLMIYSLFMMYTGPKILVGNRGDMCPLVYRAANLGGVPRLH